MKKTGTVFQAGETALCKGLEEGKFQKTAHYLMFPDPTILGGMW